MASLSLFEVMAPSAAVAMDQEARIKALEMKIKALVDVIYQQQKTIWAMLQQRGAGWTVSQSSNWNATSGATSCLADIQLIFGMRLSVWPLKVDNDRRQPDACQGMAPASNLVRLEARPGFDTPLTNDSLGPFPEQPGDTALNPILNDRIGAQT